MVLTFSTTFSETTVAPQSGDSSSSMSSSLDGLNWHQWPSLADDEEDSSNQSSLAPSPQPSLSSEQDPLLLPSSSSSVVVDPSAMSPKPSSASSALTEVVVEEDVMRLPRRDLHIFGQCPIQDDFVLVTCDVCGRHVKLEAFEQHFRLRHDRDAKASSSSGTSELKTRLASDRQQVSLAFPLIVHIFLTVND